MSKAVTIDHGLLQASVERLVAALPEPFGVLNVQAFVDDDRTEIHFIELKHTQEHFHSLGSLLSGKPGAQIDPWAAREAFRAVSTHHDNLRVRLVEDEAGRRLVTDAPWEDLPFARTSLPALSPAASASRSPPTTRTAMC